MKTNWNGETTELDLSNHNKGLYLLKVVNPLGSELLKLIRN